MRRSTGAIFRDSRPATIIRSDWRGEPRKTSAPKRAMSNREVLIAIISMAQHARPKVTGQIDDRRAHCTILVTVVVRTGISISDICLCDARGARREARFGKACGGLDQPNSGSVPFLGMDDTESPKPSGDPP